LAPRKTQGDCQLTALRDKGSLKFRGEPKKTKKEGRYMIGGLPVVGALRRGGGEGRAY